MIVPHVNPSEVKREKKKKKKEEKKRKVGDVGTLGRKAYNVKEREE